MKKYIAITVIIIMVSFLAGCGDDEEKGIGPVKQVTLGSVDKALGERGRVIFEQKCVACHKIDSKLVGPPLKGVTQRRKPEWIMNMILNPEQMTKENTTAKQLFGQYLTQMTFQNVSQDDARAILEYFRTIDSN
ncbi:MAG: cytochrome c [Bacteroidetes bacterium]|nr:cytochrome c [Bacteroidota bacterium]